MFSVCFYLQRRQSLCKQTPPSSPRGGEPSTAVTVSDALTDARCESPSRATATRADSTLCWEDRSLFATGRDTFTNYSEIHFSPSKLNMYYLIIALFTLPGKYCTLCGSCCFGIALMSGKHRGCLCGVHVSRSSLH